MVEASPSCRLEVILATGSRKAVIFRRGPSKQVRLIAWDRADDSFTPGQWVRRTRVYAERCDLSPDGSHLIAFLGKFKPPFGTYTVLSRPPYFTALALWPLGHTWAGGGAFLGPREFVLFQPDKLAPGFRVPDGFTGHPYDAHTEARLKSLVSRRPHWVAREGATDGSAIKRDASGLALVASRPRTRPYWAPCDHALLLRNRVEMALPGAQWADFDEGGDVLFAAGGRLYRLSAEAAARGDIAGSRLADFTEMRFEPVMAPYRPEWTDLSATTAEGGDVAFAPALDRVTKEDRRRRIRARKAAKAARAVSPVRGA